MHRLEKILLEPRWDLSDVTQRARIKQYTCINYPVDCDIRSIILHKFRISLWIMIKKKGCVIYRHTLQLQMMLNFALYLLSESIYIYILYFFFKTDFIIQESDKYMFLLSEVFLNGFLAWANTCLNSKRF